MVLFTHTDWLACMWVKYYLPVWRETKWLPISLWWRGKVWLKRSKVTTKFGLIAFQVEAHMSRVVSYIIFPFFAFSNLLWQNIKVLNTVMSNLTENYETQWFYAMLKPIKKHKLGSIKWANVHYSSPLHPWPAEG